MRTLIIIWDAIKVLATIQFNNQAFLGGTEVDDVIADGVLAPEMNTVELVRTEVRPEPGFCFDRSVAESVGALVCRVSWVMEGHV